MTNRTKPQVGQVVEKAGEILVAGNGSADARMATFVISDETVDRYGDIITTKGWQFDNFLNNPVVLWGHQSRELPIGRVSRLSTDGSKSKADVEFATADLNPFADSVFKMVKAGFINACSVGFKPLADPEPIFDASKALTGFKFIAQELLELSVVCVPALASALVAAKSLDIPERDYRRILAVDPGASARHDARMRGLSLLKLTGVP